MVSIPVARSRTWRYLGYDLPSVYEGRGVSGSRQHRRRPATAARWRCVVTSSALKAIILKNHSAGHISTEEADVVGRSTCRSDLGSRAGVSFYTGVQYRHLLVIKGGDKRIDCTPPHDVPLKPFRPLMIKPMPGQREDNSSRRQCRLTPRQTADLINDLILRSQSFWKIIR